MKLWFKILIVLLLIFNIAGIFIWGEEFGRYLRVATMLLFLLLYIFRFYSGKLLLVVFLLFFICDIFLVKYENVDFKALSYVTRISAYLLIIQHLYPFLRKLKLNVFTTVVSVFTMAINIYLISIMVKSVPEAMQGTFFYPLFYLFGISLLALAATGISFHNRFATKKSFYLVIACFGLIFSDICFYIAYYLNFDLFFYADRITNIVGVAFLLAFSPFRKPESAEIGIG